MEKIGEKIRIQRLIRNYSQEYMAFALDISQAAYSNLERGETEITLKRIYEIAEVLEISAFELMPKPKYATGINQTFFSRIILLFKNLWTTPFRKSSINGLARSNAEHSDI
jgi:transcriptional regulator with XRE-family HTH domain